MWLFSIFHSFNFQHFFRFSHRFPTSLRSKVLSKETRPRRPRSLPPITSLPAAAPTSPPRTRITGTATPATPSSTRCRSCKTFSSSSMTVGQSKLECLSVISCKVSPLPIGASHCAQGRVPCLEKIAKHQHSRKPGAAFTTLLTCELDE
jgi:hypothetical protein